MIRFVLYRFLIMIPTVFLISIVAFLVILAPPGDFISSYVAQLEAAGQFVDRAQIEALRARYGLNQSTIVQYTKWIGRLLRGDLGNSLQWKKPVGELLSERLPWTLVLSVSSLILVYLVGIPIGIISATHQYSVRDYVFTFLAFLGVAIPGFLSALIFLWFYFSLTGQAALGLFSREFVAAPWSLARLWDLLKHLWIPALIVGLAGTAELIRFMRANLLDELGEALRDGSSGEGPARTQTTLQVSGAGRHQPHSKHHRLYVARIDQRCPAGFPGVGLADHLTCPPQCAEEPGYVPGRQHCLHAERPHGGGYPHLRSAAGCNRPPDQIRSPSRLTA